MKHLVAFASLFTSVGTLFCCALPALFVTLGAGASFASLTSTIPQLLWLGENKTLVFIIGGVFLTLGLVLPKLFPPPVICDVDGNACAETKSWSQPLLYISIVLYAIGGFFAYLAPILLV